MRAIVSQPRVRRGLLLILDGLVIAVLAAVITARTAATGASDVAGAAVGVLSTWLTTPGVGTMEAIAYAGFAVAVLGPLWYWVVRGFVGSVDLASLLSSRGRDDDGFEFSHEASRTDRPDDEDPEQFSDGGEIYRTVLSDQFRSSQPEWAAALFGEVGRPTRNVPEGDFLRSPSGSGTEEADQHERNRVLRAKFGPPEDAASRRSVEIQGSTPDEPETREEASEPTVTVRATDLGRSAPEPDSTGHESTEAPSAGTRAARTEPVDDRTEESQPTEAGSEGDEADRATSAADEAEPTAREPVDPLERIGEHLGASRSQLGAVEDQLSRATGASGVETAGAALAERSAASDSTVSQLEAVFSDQDLRMDDAIDELRADQAALESAFDAVNRRP